MTTKMETELEQLHFAVQQEVGDVGIALKHTCNTITDECVRCWPLKEMHALVHIVTMENPKPARHAANVIGAKVRETIEARHGRDHGSEIALTAILDDVVCACLNIWFSGPKARTAFKRVRKQLREPKEKEK